MSTRYAVILTNDEGEEVVSDIKQMEGSAPDVPNGYKAVKVPDGVLIGMVKGGKKDAVGGYGFPDDAPGADVRSPATVPGGDDQKGKSKTAE
jgi:hypothetical protein